MAAFDPHQRGDLVLAMRLFDPLRRSHKFHLVGVLRLLLFHSIDQFQRAARILTLEPHWVDPDRKELRAQVSLARRLQVPVAHAARIGQTKILVQHSLRRIGVGINHDRGGMHRSRVLRFTFCHG